MENAAVNAEVMAKVLAANVQAKKKALVQNVLAKKKHLVANAKLKLTVKALVAVANPAVRDVVDVKAAAKKVLKAKAEGVVKRALRVARLIK